MSAPRAYLDWNATTPVLPAAIAAVSEALALTGNPSSIHAEGRAARALMEAARKDIARLVQASPENVFFTSGATEGINSILTLGLCATCGLDRAQTTRVLASATEHSAIFAAAPEAGVIPVDSNGILDLAALEAMLAEGGPALVAVQLANNETGVIQPIAEAARLVHAAGGALMVDAVQAPGKMAVDIGALGADVLIITAHKFGGPKGIGAMVFANGETRLERAFIRGGGQERGQRQGTENLSGIAGFAAAARAAAEVDFEAMRILRNGFEAGLRQLSNGVFIAGEAAPRLPNTSFFALPGLEAGKVVIASDLDGVAVSSGSACSSGKVGASKVLTAMGQGERAPKGAVRVSLGPRTTQGELDACLSTLSRQLARNNKA
ncbi:MAG: cysteine desulfurase [Proteobacteria bacterium]|nr:cysteine desulfurase [Pseudomonadota bacterium]